MALRNYPLSLDSISRLCFDLKKLGVRIGFTHGAFDLFHYGHLFFLTEAAKKCDFLIVGLESDKNLTSYKSYARPIIPQEQRVQIVSSLSPVGATFVNTSGWNTKSWIETGKEIKPDVLYYGRNYAASDKIRFEADRLKSKLVKINNNFESTTQIVNKILEKHIKLFPKQSL